MSFKKGSLAGLLALTSCVCLDGKVDVSSLEDKVVDWKSEAFLSTTHNYILDVHDCSDMSQELCDAFHAGGIGYDSMRFVVATLTWTNTLHMWLEVRDNARWIVYDPAGKVMGVDHDDYREAFSKVHFFSSDDTYYTTPECYTAKGDVFKNNKWSRASGNLEKE